MPLNSTRCIFNYDWLMYMHQDASTEVLKLHVLHPKQTSTQSHITQDTKKDVVSDLSSLQTSLIQFHCLPEQGFSFNKYTGCSRTYK